MKRKLILASMIALATLASCNKNEGEDPIQDVDNAYLSISLTTGSPNTYANPGTENGTPDESGVTSVVVVGFKGETKLGVYTLTDLEQGTIKQGTAPSSANAGDAFKVDAKTDNIFVVINPSTVALDAINNALTYTAMNAEIIGSADDMKGVNKFMMTSAGAVPGDKGLISVAPKKAASEKPSDIADAKAAAKTAPVLIKVDRTVVKTTMAAFTGTVVGGTASIDKWSPNTTNKKYYIYSELVKYTTDGTTLPTAPAVYRQDPNFAEAANYATEFNWLHNENNYPSKPGYITWSDPASILYILENTMEADAQNYGNTTKIVIKAKHAPTGVTLGDSWFRMSGTFYTLDSLKKIYVATATASNTKGYMDAFYDAFKAADPTNITAANFGELTVEQLDKVENGGYIAAKVKTNEKEYLIEYFQKSVCYYEVRILHDTNVDAKLLGRWGVVRNNFYTINITKITQAGKPYIPDPTDPGITDPDKPDPKDPDDKTSAYISAEIIINPWTTWTQDVEL